MNAFLSGLALVLGVLSPEARSYSSCTSMVEADPNAGLDYAEAWLSEGGGNPARHCIAVATLNLGRPAVAGAMLARLAELETRDAGVSARLYVQAAEALMAGGRQDAAFAALRQAYDKAPDTPEVHMSAASVYATAREWEGVVLTLDALSRFAALSPDALALRGRAYFEQSDYEAAARDCADALSLDPQLIDAIVLRGDLINRGQTIPDDPFASP